VRINHGGTDNEVAETGNSLKIDVESTPSCPPIPGLHSLHTVYYTRSGSSSSLTTTELSSSSFGYRLCVGGFQREKTDKKKVTLFSVSRFAFLVSVMSFWKFQLRVVNISALGEGVLHSALPPTLHTKISESFFFLTRAWAE
jgi:hypothetical protein